MTEKGGWGDGVGGRDNRKEGIAAAAYHSADDRVMYGKRRNGTKEIIGRT